ISKRLMRHFDTSTGRYKKNQEVEMLLLSRKRIIHKARRKLNKLKSILKDEYDNKGHLKYSLVYVPEGDDPDYEIQDQFEENETDQRLIHSYTKAISEIDFSVMVKQFTSGAPNRETILKNFEKGDLHVLTSMKCLDEGVDIPRSELAIFCSSTGNPRQFIQRRGRVLRTHKEKDFATIHDLVVVPKIEKKTNHYEMERGLVKKELERVVDFSFLSMNKMDTFSILNDLLDYYNLNLFEINDQNS
ncbi:MAG: helicase-related protein, partial [Cyclobacteriaceae bacterium]